MWQRSTLAASRTASWTVHASASLAWLATPQPMLHVLPPPPSPQQQTKPLSLPPPRSLMLKLLSLLTSIEASKLKRACLCRVKKAQKAAWAAASDTTASHAADWKQAHEIVCALDKSTTCTVPACPAVTQPAVADG